MWKFEIGAYSTGTLLFAVLDLGETLWITLSRVTLGNVSQNIRSFKFIDADFGKIL